MNVLAVGSHPDDIEIGCFATLARHNLDGDEIFGAIITKGEKKGDTKERQNEARESANIINMRLFFGDFPDGDVRGNCDLVDFLDNIVIQNKIDVIYTHAINDRHQDHRAVSKASMSVSRNVQEVYGYESASMVSSFIPQIFVDVTETFTLKMAALRKFKTQLKSEFVEGMEGIAKYRALQARIPGRLCESFEAYKILKNEKSSYRLKILDLQSQIESLKNIIWDMENNSKIDNRDKENDKKIKTNTYQKHYFKNT